MLNMLLNVLDPMEYKKKLAVVLFNLGGPDSPKAIKPFLYNLFKDPAIIPYTKWIRFPLAWLISRSRAIKAEKIYQHLGGRSPILGNTQNQAIALEKMLSVHLPEYESKVVIGMRYWHPFIQEAQEITQKFNPDHIVLLPLYPQFSGTTTGSSFGEWQKKASNCELTIGCYFDHPDFINSYTCLILDFLNNYPDKKNLRLLFSAHGLPQRNIEQGDPYQWQVEQTVGNILKSLEAQLPQKIDYSICYQSKVGKLEWIGPSLDDEMIRASQDRTGVLVVPISFVSEHSETLVELDIDFAQKARELNLPSYNRIPTVSEHPIFIQGLTNLVKEALDSKKRESFCPNEFTKCWCRQSC